jgi:hypothetical protein
MTTRSIKILYSIAGIGVALTFLGHGILGLKGYDKFVGLVTDNYDKVLGGTMSQDTATSLVNVIGTVDVVLAVAFLGLVFAALRGDSLAFSPLAMVLFGWAAAWGFLTALSRFTATMNGAEVWDVVERGANFMLPAALVYIIYSVRSEQAPARAETRADSRPRGAVAAAH